MGVSLKVAAGRFLKWNKKGQEVATPKQGLWIYKHHDGSCVACKIGLVMIGRYGFAKATQDYIGVDYGRTVQRTVVPRLLKNTLQYGPDITCPVKSCRGYWHNKETIDGPYYAHLGWVTEHLFEKHEWSVNRIDKWLAELAGEDND